MFRCIVFSCFLLLVSHWSTVLSQEPDVVPEEVTTEPPSVVSDLPTEDTTVAPEETLPPGLTPVAGTGPLDPPASTEAPVLPDAVTEETTLGPEASPLVTDEPATVLGEESTTLAAEDLVTETTTAEPDYPQPEPANADVGAPPGFLDGESGATELTTTVGPEETNTTLIVLPADVAVVVLPSAVPVFGADKENSNVSSTFVPPVVPVVVGKLPLAEEETISPPAAPSTTPALVGPVYEFRRTLKPAPGVAPSREGGWFWSYGLLIFAGILILGIILAMFYVCCCKKSQPERRTSIVRGSLSDGREEIITIARPIDQLNKSNNYVDEVISSHQYRETKREPFTAAPSFTPNNSFANAAVASSMVNRTPAAPGVVVTEEKTAKTVTIKSTPDRVVIPIGTAIDASPRSAPAYSKAPPSGTQYNFITPRHLDQSYVHPVPVPQTWNERRLEPTNSAPVTSRDVISASRVNNAVVSVAAASNTPLRGSPVTRPSQLDGDGSRGSTLERSVSPTGKPVYRTTLHITPQHNRDPNDPEEQGNDEVMTYGQYVDMIKGPPSDFGQYSPDRPVTRERRREDNTESQV